MTFETQVPGNPSEPVLNLEVARQRLGGDEELLRDLAGFFIEDAPRLVEDTRAAIDSGDMETATRTAHSLKGLASNFEATAAVAIAHELELTTRNGQTREAGSQLERLEQAVERVMNSLRRQVLG